MLQINAVLNFLFVKVSWKKKRFTDILSSTTAFLIDSNKECILSMKSAYKYDFLKDHKTLSAENLGIKYISKYIKLYNSSSKF